MFDSFRFEIVDVYMHPDLDINSATNQWDNDLAMLELNATIFEAPNYDPNHVQVIELTPDWPWNEWTEHYLLPFNVYGWGRSSYSEGSITDPIQQITMTGYQHSLCK